MVPAPEAPGILTVREADFGLTPAQRVNLVPVVARGYEPLWRSRSVGILTGGAMRTGEELARLVEWLQPREGERLLDAGCSAGLYARTLVRAAPGAVVHGVDVSLPFLRQAARRTQGREDEMVWVRADVERLPYRDGAFDAVASGGSLNEFRDPDAAIRELTRVLTPGGRIFLMYTARAERPWGRVLQRMLEPSGINFPRQKDVLAWAQAVGLVQVHARVALPIALELYEKPLRQGQEQRTPSPAG